ncbi:MAG: hypothetical protein PUC88_03100 [Clostridia bacterium]|nr:hypothetical protein [Clostridia bacterium]
MIGGNYVSIRGQHLNKYCYSSSGGMSGGYYSKTIKRYDDAHALISIEKVEWHSQDPEVNEYLVDVSIMDELEEIIRKYRMNFWNRKKFSNMFIADGESIGYSFTFDKDYIDLSSQYYPARYSDKLHKFDEIIEKYLNDAKKLPGLVNTRKDSDISYELAEGELELYVYSYSSDYLGIRILNGKDEQIEISHSYKLINTDKNKAIDENDDKYTMTIYPKSQDEVNFSLKERLEAGNYKLVLGEIEIPFEIR